MTNLVLNLSVLDQADYIEIVANLKYNLEDAFRCKDDEKFKDFKDPQKAKESHSIISFCDGAISDSRPSYSHYYDGIDFLTCPCTFHNPQILTLVELEGYFNKFGPSNIYNDRGLPDFPVKLLQSFRVVRRFMLEKEAEELKKAEDRAKQKIK